MFFVFKNWDSLKIDEEQDTPRNHKIFLAFKNYTYYSKISEKSNSLIHVVVTIYFVFSFRSQFHVSKLFFFGICSKQKTTNYTNVGLVCKLPILKFIKLFPLGILWGSPLDLLCKEASVMWVRTLRFWLDCPPIEDFQKITYCSKRIGVPI